MNMSFSIKRKAEFESDFDSKKVKDLNYGDIVAYSHKQKEDQSYGISQSNLEVNRLCGSLINSETVLFEIESELFYHY